MRKEPTAATAAGIYKLLDMELEDLNTVDIREADQAFRLICEAADDIRDEMGNIFLIMQDAGEITEAGTVQDPEKVHGQFTEIYRAAIQIAGKAVRLAAVTRQGIIQSEIMNPVDRVYQ